MEEELDWGGAGKQKGDKNRKMATKVKHVQEEGEDGGGDKAGRPEETKITERQRGWRSREAGMEG